MLGWVVGGVWDDSICESGFSIYGCLPAHGGLMDGYVKVHVVYLDITVYKMMTSVGQNV